MNSVSCGEPNLKHDPKRGIRGLEGKRIEEWESQSDRGSECFDSQMCRSNWMPTCGCSLQQKLKEVGAKERKNVG